MTHAMLCEPGATPAFVQYIENLSHISTCSQSGVEEIQQFKHENTIWNELPAPDGQKNINGKESSDLSSLEILKMISKTLKSECF